jgi:HEAT repeat protein
MNDEIQKLITSLRVGDYEDPAEKISLLSAALLEHKADVSLLLSLLRAPQLPLRLAAIDASRERPEPEILAEIVTLAGNTEDRVRVKVAEVLIHRSDDAAANALRRLGRDSVGIVRAAVVRSTTGRPDFIG